MRNVACVKAIIRYPNDGNITFLSSFALTVKIFLMKLTYSTIESYILYAVYL